jgi:putative transposase
MPRPLRFVVPGLPHHVTQRGNYRQNTFSEESDYFAYLRLLREQSIHFGVSVQAYCLMPNHTHLILVPAKEDALPRMMQRLHADYARYVHLKTGRVGHLWQARYFSAPMDDHYFWQAMVYVERNPQHANLVINCWDWRWSSAVAHLHDTEDGLLDLGLFRQQFTGTSWKTYLQLGVHDAALLERIQASTRRGWPMGSEDFLTALESDLGRSVRPHAPGRKSKSAAAGEIGI